jgi:peroxiredoxin (alkyl hydroperoxide reductase subunit C)
VWAQQAFRAQLGVQIEQLSDFEPKGAACRAFGVLHRGGFPERALVLVGPDGVVRWSHQADSPGDLPGANLVFDALDR